MSLPCCCNLWLAASVSSEPAQSVTGLTPWACGDLKLRPSFYNSIHCSLYYKHLKIYTRIQLSSKELYKCSVKAVYLWSAFPRPSSLVGSCRLGSWGPILCKCCRMGVFKQKKKGEKDIMKIYVPSMLLQNCLCWHQAQTVCDAARHGIGQNMLQHYETAGPYR